MYKGDSAVSRSREERREGGRDRLWTGAEAPGGHQPPPLYRGSEEAHKGESLKSSNSAIMTTGLRVSFRSGSVAA